MEPVLLVLTTIILGPPALLIYLGRKYIYLKMSQPDRRDFLIGFFGALLVNTLLAGTLLLSKLLASSLWTPTPDWVLTAISLAPWVINGVLLGLTLIFRRAIAIGIVSLIGFIVAWGVFSFVLFAVSCGIFILIGSILSF
jgi:hypothetical protein